MLLVAHLSHLQTDNELLLSISSVKKKKKEKDLPVQKVKRNAQYGHAQPLVTFSRFSLQLCWKTSR